MTLPRLPEIEVALLKALVALRGQAPANQVYPEVTKRFPELTAEQLAEVLPSGGNRWTNRIQWVRLRLVEKGEMTSPAYGVWAISEKGRGRIKREGKKEADEPPIASLVDLHEDYEGTFRAKCLDRLLQMNPREFEHFARKLLRIYGFVEVHVTGMSNDGGIDGYGKLRLGLASMNVAFQCRM
jgi:restriction system protein